LARQATDQAHQRRGEPRRRSRQRLSAWRSWAMKIYLDPDMRVSTFGL
jgi:hypothetical protein